MVFAILNALFWLIAVRFTDLNEIGLTSSAFSLATLFTSVAILSIEYPLLKYISNDKSYFGSILVFEIIIHLLLIPILWIAFQRITDDIPIFVLTIIIMVCNPIQIISGVALMGSLSIRPIVIIEIISGIVKISILMLVLHFQLGTIGLMMALACQFIILALVLSIIALKKFGLKIKIKSLKITLLEGISNFPTKFSTVLQYFGTISILALFLIPQEDIAGFTIAYGFIVFISVIPARLALLAIPSSIEQKRDLSASSATWSMALAIPIITVMFISPNLVLSIYTDSYTKYDVLLAILTISVIPFILKTNVVAKLNNDDSLRKITLLGTVEMSIFLISIMILIPSMGVIGSAWAIAIASISTGILSLYFATNIMRKIFFISVLTLITGVVTGILAGQIIDNRFVVTVIAFGISTGSLFVFKLIRFSDVLLILDQIRNKNK